MNINFEIERILKYSKSYRTLANLVCSLFFSVDLTLRHIITHDRNVYPKVPFNKHKNKMITRHKDNTSSTLTIKNNETGATKVA